MNWPLAFGISLICNIALAILVFLKTSPSSFLAQATMQRSRQTEREQESLKRLRVLLTDFYREQFLASLKTAQSGILFDKEIRDLSEMLTNIMRRVKDEAGRCAKPIRTRVEMLENKGASAIRSIISSKREGLMHNKELAKESYLEIEASYNEIISLIESALLP